MPPQVCIARSAASHAEPVGAVVAHRDEVGDLHVVLAVERSTPCSGSAGAASRPRCAARRAGTGSPGCVDSGLPHVDAAVGVGDGLVDAELRGAERRRGLADAVLVHEVLRELEPVVDLGRTPRRRRRARRCSVTSAWSVGMLNVHQKKSTLKPGGVGRHEERGDAERARRARPRCGRRRCRGSRGAGRS